MNTKIWLSGTAILLGLAGIAASFLPHEILEALGISPTGATPVIIQLLGALLFAFAIANWTARGSAIGGIYNRPLAAGNLTHFTIGALTLMQAALARGDNWFLTGAALVYLVLAIGSARIFFSRGTGPARDPKPN